MEASREFVYQKFSEFYKDPANAVPAPPLPHQREFGYLTFKEKYMVRHRRFEQIANFRTVLADTVPSDVYHSCAYYENPDFDMDKKGWIGSDVVFDIDADHIPTPCNKIHDEFRCTKCGFEGRGITPEECPCCGGTKFETKIWACDLCIQSARDEAAKLLDMLEKDFGFAQREMRVFFSGHRGYHIHIENEAVRSLDAMARKEIVDYVTGLGLSILDKDDKEEGSIIGVGQELPEVGQAHLFNQTGSPHLNHLDQSHFEEVGEDLACIKFSQEAPVDDLLNGSGSVDELIDDLLLGR